MKTKQQRSSRRDFVRTCAAGSLVPFAFGSLLRPGTAKAASRTGPAGWRVPLDGDWLFGGKLSDDATKRQFNDEGFSKITLPHCVAKLSWQDWDPAAWEDVWAYRRHFSLPGEFRNRRLFVQFDGVMTGASPAINEIGRASWRGRGENLVG